MSNMLCMEVYWSWFCAILLLPSTPLGPGFLVLHISCCLFWPSPVWAHPRRFPKRNRSRCRQGRPPANGLTFLNSICLYRQCIPPRSRGRTHHTSEHIRDIFLFTYVYKYIYIYVSIKIAVSRSHFCLLHSTILNSVFILFKYIYIYIYLYIVIKIQLTCFGETILFLNTWQCRQMFFLKLGCNFFA